MHLLYSLLLSIILLSNTTWQTDFEKAKAEAKTENKFILLNFSGSDWCGPCIRLRKEIFDSGVFTKYADGKLILVNADFPRLKKTCFQKSSKNKMMHSQINITVMALFR